MSSEHWMRIGVGFNADLPVCKTTNYAILAEELGYDSLWLHEHSFGRDALSYLSSTAQSTARIRLGVACLSPYSRHPVVLAMSMLTLQETSGGRAILGLGTGFPMRLDLMGIGHPKPIAALKETFDICRGIWSGNFVNYSGKVFSVRNVKSLPGKSYSRIPIYVAGWRKQMLSLTGRYADGYVGKGGESTQSIMQIVSSIKSAASKNGRSISEIDIGAYLLTLVANSKENALESARRDPFVNYMLSVQDDYLYEGTGIDPAKKKLIAEYYFKGNIAESSRYVTDDMLEAFTVLGTSDQVCDRIIEFAKAGLTLPILQPIIMSPDGIRDVLNAGSSLVNETKSEAVATA